MFKLIFLDVSATPILTYPIQGVQYLIPVSGQYVRISTNIYPVENVTWDYDTFTVSAQLGEMIAP